jgi:hypothetical protein
MSMPAPSGPSASEPGKKPQRWPWILGVIVSLFVGIGIGVLVAYTPSETLEPCTGGSPVTTLPPAEGASWDNPVPVGEAVCVGKWRIQVVGYIPNATDVLRNVNTFHKKPQSGNTGW